jgi:hypothetical protein
MADNSGKTWMNIGETDDPNAAIETYTAGAAITKGDPVYLSADDTVSPATSAQDCLGIAAKTIASGQPCPVIIRGRVKVKVGGAVTRGKAVYGADSTKRVLQLADQAVNEGGTGTYTIYYARRLGVAIESASAADDLIFIYVER